MGSGRSLKLAQVFGIRIGVHPSWFVVLFLIIWSLSGAFTEIFGGDQNKAFAAATVTALLFFTSVVLHELGHAVVAIRNGIGIAGIDLWLFGGVARMRRESDSAGADFRVAVAGPVVTLVLALLGAGVGTALVGSDAFVRSLAPGQMTGGVIAVLAYVTAINVLLLVFNLLPGFPLDGGRIVRSIAWWITGERARATRIAARLGRLFAFGLAGLGVFALFSVGAVTGIWLVVMGLFLGTAARSSELESSVTARIEGLRVRDVMDDEPVSVPAAERLDRVFEDFFLRYRFPWFPVVDAAGRFVGLVRREQVEEVPDASRADSTADQVLSERGSTGVRIDDPLERLLGSEELGRLGAVVALDADGVLRGVVTVGRVRRALRAAAPGVTQQP